MISRKKKKSLAKAIRMSEAFFGLVARSVKSLTIVWPRSLVLVGKCAEVHYICDKEDGVWRRYTHQFKGNVLLFAGPDPQGNGDNVLIIKGKFKINERGIIG